MSLHENYEDGIVKDVKEGIAVIKIHPSLNCEKCSVKSYCRFVDSRSRSLVVKDPLGVHAGDKVRIAIKSKNAANAFLIYYLIPFCLFIFGILYGMNSFKHLSDLYSVLLGTGLLGLYSISLSMISKFKRFILYSLPVITCVSPPVN